MKLDYTSQVVALEVDMPFAVDYEYENGKPSKNFVVNIDESNLDQYLSTDHHLYELLKNPMRKLYMDIDHIRWTAEELNAAVRNISSLVENELHKTLDRNELVVLISGNIESVHLIFNDVVMNYKEQHLLMDAINDQLTFTIDTAVYTSNRQFRCIHQSKKYKPNATPLIAYTQHNQVDFNLFDTLVGQYKDGLECSYAQKPTPKKHNPAF